MVSFLDQLCSYYGLSVDQYKHLIQPATRHDLVAFSSYPDHQRFLRVLYKHLDTHHRVLVYGDYDADGMFSRAILVDRLKPLRQMLVSIFHNVIKMDMAFPSNKLKGLLKKNIPLLYVSIMAYPNKKPSPF